MAMTAPTLPTEYLTELDSILTHESYSARYAVQGAEFVNAKQVSVPEITFDGGTNKYDRFKTENSGALSYTTYTLDHDQEAVFYVDAVEDADAQSILSTQTAAEFERQKLIPEVDTGFGMVVVLEVVDEMAGLGAGPVKEEGTAALHGDAPPKHARHLVVGGHGLEARARQVQVARGAEGVLRRCQPLSAGQTEARGKEVYQS